MVVQDRLMNGFGSLLESIDRERRLIIQCHDYPDHDAVAAAFGLLDLFKRYGIESRIVYAGDIQLESLSVLIHDLKIPIGPAAQARITENDQILVVDGCKGNRNVTDLRGIEIGIIDHHLTEAPEDVAFIDIRPDLGSSATLVFLYYQEMGVDPARAVATALMIGLLTDTALLTRGVSRQDVETYSSLYELANVQAVNSLLRNKIQKRDLTFYRRALDQVRIERGIAFCHFPLGCNQNLLGIIADFFLALMEVEFVFLSAQNEGSVNFSLRSENPAWNAAMIIKDLIEPGGFGGGHAEMAGGVLPDSAAYDPERCRMRLIAHLLPETGR